MLLNIITALILGEVFNNTFSFCYLNIDTDMEDYT